MDGHVTGHDTESRSNAEAGSHGQAATYDEEDSMLKLTLSALLLAAMSACAASDGDLAAADEPNELALETPRVADATRKADLPAECGGLQDVAATLLGSYQKCARDADCGAELVHAACMNGFLCPVAVNKDADIERLTREAAALSFAYQKACTTACPVARCAAPTRSYCDKETRRCKNSFEPK